LLSIQADIAVLFHTLLNWVSLDFVESRARLTGFVFARAIVHAIIFPFTYFFPQSLSVATGMSANKIHLATAAKEENDERAEFVSYNQIDPSAATSTVNRNSATRNATIRNETETCHYATYASCRLQLAA
jgi:hypothetical protein